MRNIYLHFVGMYKTPSNSIHILNSHFISAKDSNPELFRNQLIELSKQVEFINFEDAVSMIVNKETPKTPLVAFTYDDGFEECHSMIAPVLEEFGIKAAFFINPAFIDGDKVYQSDFVNRKVLTSGKKPLTWEMVIDLKERGHTIGSHTMDHLRLNINDDAIIEYQLKKSKEVIENKISSRCEYFAYPYGQLRDISEIALVMAKKHYRYIFSGANYKKYFSNNNQLINRRHAEGNWDINHVKYFLSTPKTY